MTYDDYVDEVKIICDICSEKVPSKYIHIHKEKHKNELTFELNSKPIFLNSPE